MSEAAQILLYGLLAAASPLALLATLAVLSTRRARANGSAFAGGFLLGQSFALAIPLLVGSIAIPEGGSNGTISASFELTIGLLLLAAALRLRHPRAPRRAARGESRTAALLARLGRVTPRTAFSIGIPFGIGVKRLMISVLAASTIALGGEGQAGELGLSVLYVLIASLLVWLPVGVYLVAGTRADDWVSRSKEWLALNQRQLTFASTLVLGLLFTVAALIRLV